MWMHSYPVAAAVMLSLAACYPLSVEYTESEAPKQLRLDEATIRVDLRFAPGSSRLVAGEAARLRALAATGRIAPADRVLVSAGGPPAVASARVAMISEALLPYGIVVSPAVVAEVAPDRAVVAVERYLVSLPPCPNWSKTPVPDEFSNSPSSNFGCTTVTNLGRMVASPADLASGQPLGLAAGKPAVDAVRRYLFDIAPGGTGVKPLIGAATSTVVAAGGAAAGGGGGGGGGGGSTGGSTGSEE
jgi:type IV pilus biogenesis protein CpaD/CtpE